MENKRKSQSVVLEDKYKGTKESGVSVKLVDKDGKETIINLTLGGR